MWDHKHYVPVLRWKQAEWTALGELRASSRVWVTPLIEITPRSIAPRKLRPNVEQMLSKNVADLATNWKGLPVFIDLLHLRSSLRTGDGTHPLTFIGAEARRRGVEVIPVTAPERSRDFQNAVRGLVAADRRGVCLRLLRAEISNSTARDVEQLLAFLQVRREDADLILDYQLTPNDLNDLDYREMSALFPNLEEWRTVTIISGAFPRDLTGFRVGQHELPRRDWVGWLAIQNQDEVVRKPAFGDYTIQYGIYSEPPDFPNFSASIRYTSMDYWVIMRGEGVFNDDGPGFGQWPANAQLLCDRPEFCGSQFSEGDRYIYQMGLQSARTGAAETWLRAGINHHLTYVAGQVASLDVI